MAVIDLQYLDWLGQDPYANLALERHLINTAKTDTCTLLLWQNDNTVVIGCNQNPWKECQTSILDEDHVKLARRYSGGGAVYHDLGNLNFSFICPEDIYDQQRQFSVILRACKDCGIDAVLSGRNDMQVDGRKFSGNAFLHLNGISCHHGTLLIHSDYGKLSKYLTPSKAKLEAKGVNSVRSRVTNLQEISPALTVEDMKHHLICAFQDEYSSSPAPIHLTPADTMQIELLSRQLGHRDWIYGKRSNANCTFEGRFHWGGICLELDVQAATVAAVRVYTDSLDWHLAESIEKALIGVPFHKASLLQAMRTNVEEGILQDIGQILNI